MRRTTSYLSTANSDCGHIFMTYIPFLLCKLIMLNLALCLNLKN